MKRPHYQEIADAMAEDAMHHETQEQRAARLASVHRMRENMIKVNDAPPPTGIAIMLALFCLAALSLGLAVSGIVAMWIW